MAQRRLDADFTVGCGVVPLVQSLDADNRKIATTGLDLRLVRNHFQMTRRPAAHHNDFFSSSGGSIRGDWRHVNAIGTGAKAETHRSEERRVGKEGRSRWS